MLATLLCRTKPVEAILEAELKANTLFVPVIDGPGGVIPEELHVLASKRPPIPVLIGNVHDERFATCEKFD